MRFMMLVRSDAKTEAGVPPDATLLAEMGKLQRDMVKAGVVLATEPLEPSSKGVRVRLSGKQFTVTNGPFSEPTHLLAGYWMLDVKSKAEAIDWAKRVPATLGEIELRPLFELSDFPADPCEKPDGWRDQEQQFRDQTATQAPARRPGTKRFILMLKSDKMTETGALPDEKLLTEMGGLMDDMAKAGALLSGEGLKPSAAGVRIGGSAGKRTVIDGPFAEAKEMIAGYTMIQVKSREEAVEWTKRFLRIHADGLHLDGADGEIREMLETPPTA